jgi:hypothetical protein
MAQYQPVLPPFLISHFSKGENQSYYSRNSPAERNHSLENKSACRVIQRPNRVPHLTLVTDHNSNIYLNTSNLSRRRGTLDGD